MTSSSKDMKAGSVLQSSGEERRRGPLDQLPPPANSNKPLTPFSIEDILNKPSVKKSVGSLCPAGAGESDRLECVSERDQRSVLAVMRSGGAGEQNI